MSAHNSSIAIFPSSQSSGAKRFPCKFCIPGLGFQDAPKEGVQQMRAAPGSASKDPTKVPFLWHQGKEFQPGFVVGLFFLSFNKTKINLYSKIFSWQQERIRVQQPREKAPPYLITTPAEKKLN